MVMLADVVDNHAGSGSHTRSNQSAFRTGRHAADNRSAYRGPGDDLRAGVVVMVVASVCKCR